MPTLLSRFQPLMSYPTAIRPPAFGEIITIINSGLPKFPLLFGIPVTFTPPANRNILFFTATPPGAAREKEWNPPLSNTNHHTTHNLPPPHGTIISGRACLNPELWVAMWSTTTTTTTTHTIFFLPLVILILVINNQMCSLNSIWIYMWRELCGVTRLKNDDLCAYLVEEMNLIKCVVIVVVDIYICSSTSCCW